MARKIGQMRYYQDASGGKSNNYPTGLTANSLKTGRAFFDITSIVQLGIQTLPGTKVYINNHPNPIIVGATGIYELNIDGLSEISSLRFDSASMDLIASNPNAYLIIDYIYEEEGT